jgi:putative nucleotidyltransferase with HDIG domain
MSEKANEKQILLIEDNVGLAELIRESLEDSGKQVVVAKSGSLAREWLQSHTPQLVLLDYSLPDMTGKDFVTMMSQLAGSMPPFIVTTGAGDERIAVEMMKIGARDYLVKDINFLETLPLVVDRFFREITTEQRLEHSERELHASEERYRIIFENSSIAIWEANFSKVRLRLEELKSGGLADFQLYFDVHPEEVAYLASLVVIEHVNKTSMYMFGVETVEQLINWRGTVFKQKSLDYFKSLMFAIIRGDLTFQHEVSVSNLNDQPLVLMLYINVLPGCEQTLEKVLVSFVDITERKRRENELQLMATVSAALRMAASRSEMLPIILDQASALLKTPLVALVMYEQDTDECVVECARGSWQEMQSLRQPMPISASGRILASGQPFRCENTQTEPILAGTFSAVLPLALAAVPLSINQRKIGVLWAGYQNGGPKKHFFSSEAIQLLGVIADIAANAIHRITLYEETQRAARDLSRAYDRTLEGWARALELRDQETEGHTRRVVSVTLELARAMGLPEEELEPIRRGALLHDIGKMGIPDSILLKPGTLTEREWEIMRRHPEYAVDMLTPIEYLRSALDIPYCHHEKWDGSGYPRKLKGEDIPLAARLFAVVDVWDALTSDRSYRPAWTTEQARIYMQEQRGKHFDPRILDAFWKLIS